MPDLPPFAIRFRRHAHEHEHREPAHVEAGPYRAPGRPRDVDEPPPCDGGIRPPFYHQALAFAARAFALSELATNERYHLRDQLERKAAAVPQLIAQALASADMQARRLLYARAHAALTDCAAILDLVAERGTTTPITLAPMAALALELLDALRPLTVPPPRVR